PNGMASGSGCLTAPSRTSVAARPKPLFRRKSASMVNPSSASATRPSSHWKSKLPADTCFTDGDEHNAIPVLSLFPQSDVQSEPPVYQVMLSHHPLWFQSQGLSFMQIRFILRPRTIALILGGIALYLAFQSLIAEYLIEKVLDETVNE